MVTAVAPVRLILNLPTPTDTASATSSWQNTFIIPTRVTPVPPVNVMSCPPDVAKFIILKSNESPSAVSDNPETKLDAVSVALLLPEVGVHCTIPVKIFAADSAVAPSSVVA